MKTKPAKTKALDLPLDLPTSNRMEVFFLRFSKLHLQRGV